MAIRKVARLGHPVLRGPAREIPCDQITSEPVARLLRDLKDTMLEYDGIGLAAPQIHEPLRAFVMYLPPDPEQDFAGIPPTFWINPTLTADAPDMVTGWEGCLSIPDLRGQVSRHRAVTVEGYGADGERRCVRYEGLPAIVAQHEYDHLDGVVFLDRMTDMKTLAFVREHERFGGSPGDDTGA